jgi:hypothetical protein
MASAGDFFVRRALSLQARWRHLSLDEKLAAGYDPAGEPALAKRAEQLCSPRHRRKLAAWIVRIADERDRNGYAGVSAAVPIVREQVAAARGSLLELAEVLRGAQPVRPRGVAIVQRLLSDGNSDMYTKTARGAVAIQVQAAMRALNAGYADSALSSASATPEGRPRLTQTAYR